MARSIEDNRRKKMMAKKNKLRVITYCCMFAVLFTPFTMAGNPPDNSMLLSNTEISNKIKDLPGWTTNGKEISRTFEFKDFVAAVDFVNQLVEPAESAGHHPDLAISYNKVVVTLSTHDAGGLTDLDFSLAEQISQLKL